jgi:hypothetical protein
MRLAKLFSLLFALASCTIVRAQTCSVCNWNDDGTTSCGFTCTAAGPGCLGCCYTLLNHQVCYTGGCCQCIPGPACFCQDQSGGTCGNQPCKKKTLAVSDQIAKDSLGLSLDAPLKETAWGQDNTLLEDIRAHSATFGKIVEAMRAMASDDAHVNEGRRGTFLVAIRKHYAVRPEFFWFRDTWKIEIDRPDPLEGPGGANILEIIDRKWQLIHHVHGVDKERTVVASGSF